LKEWGFIAVFADWFCKRMFFSTHSIQRFWGRPSGVHGKDYSGVFKWDALVLGSTGFRQAYESTGVPLLI
jgi:hypothetical protein